jgi:hypothetical protein
MPGKVKDIMGQRFSRVTVVRLMPERKNRGALWLCECTCGAQIIVAGNSLQTGNTSSCGCLKREIITTHGLSGHELFHTWQMMIERCENPNVENFHLYGGRGIKVCERWRHSFPNFLADMGERPSPNHSVDRYPNLDGNYEKDNCRWATQRQQTLNRRKSRTWGIRETTSGTYRVDFQVRYGGPQLYLGAYTTEALALVIRNQAELARDKDIAIRRGEGGGVVFVDRGVRLTRTRLYRLIYPYYDGDQLAA